MKRCPTCKQPVPEKPRDEVVTVEGLSYTIHHWDGMGRTVDSPCSCFGGFRCHSTHACPWMRQRAALEVLGEEKRAKYLCAREVTEAALRAWEGPPLTAMQTDALFKQAARVSLGSQNGIFGVNLLPGRRSSIRVLLTTNHHKTGWVGSVGPRGGVKKAAA